MTNYLETAERAIHHHKTTLELGGYAPEDALQQALKYKRRDGQKQLAIAAQMARSEKQADRRAAALAMLDAADAIEATYCEL